MNIRNGLVYLVSNIYVAAIPFCLMPFLLRVLSPSEYGVVGMFSSLVGLLTTLAGLALVSFLRNKLNENNPELSRHYIHNCNALVSFIGCFLFAVGMVLQTNSITIGGVYPDLLLVSVGFAVAQAYVGLGLVVWQLKSESVRYGGYLVASSTVSALFTVLFVFVLDLADRGRIYSMTIPTIIAGFYLFVRFVISIKHESISAQTIVRILKYVTPLLPHALTLTGILFAARLLVEQELGSEAVGFYTVAFQLAAPITILVTSINLQFKVYSNRLMRAERHRDCVRASYLLILIFGASALLFGCFVSYFFEYIVGANFVVAKPLTFIFIVSAFLKGVYLIVSKGLMFLGATKIIMYISLSTACLYLLSLYFAESLEEFVVYYCLYNLLLTGLVWFWANRVYPQPWFSRFSR